MITAILIIVGATGGGLYIWERIKGKQKDKEIIALKGMLKEKLIVAKGYGGE